MHSREAEHIPNQERKPEVIPLIHVAAPLSLTTSFRSPRQATVSPLPKSITTSLLTLPASHNTPPDQTLQVPAPISQTSHPKTNLKAITHNPPPAHLGSSSHMHVFLLPNQSLKFQTPLHPTFYSHAQALEPAAHNSPIGSLLIGLIQSCVRRERNDPHACKA